MTAVPAPQQDHSVPRPALMSQGEIPVSPDAVAITHRHQATRVAIAATVGNTVCLTAAISATFGTFLVPIATQFDWPRAQVSGALGVVALVTAIVYPLIGRVIDRVGARPMLIGGNIALGVLIVLLSRVPANMTVFYLEFALLGLAGATCATPMICKVVSNWFDDRRGLMLGLTAGLGNGLGATLLPVVAGILLPRIGWRDTYAVIGLIVLALGAPVLIGWLRDAPVRNPAPANAPNGIEAADLAPVRGLTLGQAARTSRFWIMLVAVAAGAGGMTAVFTHVVPMMTDRDFSLDQATGVIAIFALVTACWQVITGSLLDKVRSPLLVVPMFASAIAGLLLLQFGQGMGATSLAGVLLGIGMGAEYAALPYFTSRYFGLANYGGIIGAMFSAVVIAQGITPALMDMSFDASGSYAHAALAIAGVLALAMGLLLALPGMDRIEREMEALAPA